VRQYSLLSQEAVKVIVLIVHATMKPGTEEEAKRIYREVTESTRKEPGCLQYVIHQSTENPLNFAFYESYTDQAAVDAHRATPHFARYKTAIAPLEAAHTREFFVPVS